MKVTVEFTGLAREIAQESAVILEISKDTTYRGLVQILAENYPGFVGVLIAPDKENFLSSNMFVIDGDLANPAMIMDHCPREGENMVLMSVITGG